MEKLILLISLLVHIINIFWEVFIMKKIWKIVIPLTLLIIIASSIYFINVQANGNNKYIENEYNDVYEESQKESYEGTSSLKESSSDDYAVKKSTKLP